LNNNVAHRAGSLVGARTYSYPNHVARRWNRSLDGTCFWRFPGQAVVGRPLMRPTDHSQRIGVEETAMLFDAASRVDRSGFMEMACGASQHVIRELCGSAKSEI